MVYKLYIKLKQKHNIAIKLAVPKNISLFLDALDILLLAILSPYKVYHFLLLFAITFISRSYKTNPTTILNIEYI